MKRKQAMQIYGHLYKKNYPVMKDEVCQCCGVSTDLEWDHCPAITTAQLFARNDNIRFILVLLCKECNQSLSDKLVPDFPSRFYFCKEALLERYKGDLVSECRNNMTNTLESLKLADAKFTRLLDRIGFGLVKIDQLSDKHLAILNLETVSGFKIIEHLSERPGHGLLSESNLDEDNEDDQDDQEVEDSVEDEDEDEEEYEDDEDDEDDEEEYEEKPKSKVVRQAVSKRPAEFYKKKQPWMDVTTLEGFKVFLRNEWIYTKNGYAKFLSEKPKIAERMNLPNHPSLYFNCSWDALTSNVNIVTESGEQYSLDIIETYITSNMIGARLIGKSDLVELLDKLDIISMDEYLELWHALKAHSVDVIKCLPGEPESTYGDWDLW